MICDRASCTDIRRYGRNPPHRALFHEGRPVQITSTPCNFGGVRWWFLCPECGRCCAILYPTLCRLCCRGRYELEALSPHDRLIKRALRLRARLGQREDGLIAPFPPKPHGMHWHTYLRLRRQSEDLERRVWANAAAWQRRQGWW